MMNSLIHKKLIYLYLQLFILNATLFYFFKVPQQNWGYQEFLINYSGGFVRRGLPGTLLVWAKDLFEISPYTIIFLVNGIAINFISFATYYILVLLKNLSHRSFLFIYFNPALVLFIGSGDTFARKDWIMISTILLHSLISLKVYNCQIDQNYYSKILIMLGLALGAISLSHEINVYFTSLHIFMIAKNIQFFGNHNGKIVNIRNAIIVSQILVLTLSVRFHGSPELSQVIQDSLPLDIKSDLGLEAIDALGRSLNDNLNLIAELLSFQTIVGYLFLTISGPFLIYLISFRRKTLVGNINPAYLLVIFFALLISGWDWGRWISLISFCIIAIIPFFENKPKDSEHKNLKLSFSNRSLVRRFMPVLILFCSITFSIPIGGPRPFYGFDFSIWAQLVDRLFHFLL